MLLRKQKKTSAETPDSFTVSNAIEWGKERNHFAIKFLDSFYKTMQRKYDYQVFIDLNSDSGYHMLEGHSQPSLPLQILEKDLFSKHIFVVEEQEESNALNVRIKKLFPKANSIIFTENINSCLDKIVPYIPETNIKHKVASVALVTIKYPDVEFETLRMLHEMGTNLIILFSLPWEDEKHFEFCIKEERELLNSFLPVKWAQINEAKRVNSNESFFRVLSRSLHQGLKELGYQSTGSFHRVDDRSDNRMMFMGSYIVNPGGKKLQKTFNQEITTQVNLFQ